MGSVTKSPHAAVPAVAVVSIAYVTVTVTMFEIRWKKALVEYATTAWSCPVGSAVMTGTQVPLSTGGLLPGGPCGPCGPRGPGGPRGQITGPLGGEQLESSRRSPRLSS